MMNFAKPQKFKATVTEKVKITPHVYLAKYSLINPPSIDFIAGQTMMITVAPNIFRSMSIGSPPTENTVITSFQDTTPGGPGSQVDGSTQSRGSSGIYSSSW